MTKRLSPVWVLPTGLPLLATLLVLATLSGCATTQLAPPATRPASQVPTVPQAAMVTVSGELATQASLPIGDTINEPLIPTDAGATLGSEVALRAIALVGKPYRYGGADLNGFDCSGLVYYVHQALGFSVPRTAADQQRSTTHLVRGDLKPGDLLFFHTTRRARISHVGIYVGENRFVHAPQSGKHIELRNMDDDYYAPRLVALGRFSLDKFKAEAANPDSQPLN